MGIDIKINAFEGPLDLLLHLIEKNKVDIYDIPIVEITNQYMEYIRQMQREDLNVMSEFLVMAATLLDIKCKMLLPKEVKEDGEEEEYNDLFKYGDNNYSVCHEQRSVNGNTIYVTTNLRVLVENNWLDDLKYLCEPTEYHEKRITVKFICDRGVSHEFVRHRVFSFAQESTRQETMAA